MNRCLSGFTGSDVEFRWEHENNDVSTTEQEEQRLVGGQIVFEQWGSLFIARDRGAGAGICPT